MRDLEKLDEEVKGDVIFHPVKTILEVINIAFPNEVSSRLKKEELDRIEEDKNAKEEEEKVKGLALQAEAFSKAFKWQ